MGNKYNKVRQGRLYLSSRSQPFYKLLCRLIVGGNHSKQLLLKRRAVEPRVLYLCWICVC